jgi:hypothetical protein
MTVSHSSAYRYMAFLEFLMYDFELLRSQLTEFV